MCHLQPNRYFKYSLDRWNVRCEHFIWRSTDKLRKQIIALTNILTNKEFDVLNEIVWKQNPFVAQGRIDSYIRFIRWSRLFFCFHSKRIVHSGRVRFKCDNCDAYSRGIAFQVFILYWGKKSKWICYLFRLIQSNWLNISRSWFYDRIYKS